MSGSKKRIPLIYIFFQKLIKAAMKIFFQKIDLRHGENVPEKGPVVFVANHPDSQMDAFVLSSILNRQIRYIAHAGLFANKFKTWLLRSCGVIPVYNRKGESDRAERNVGAFRECYEVLEKGEAIGIFPEGISDMSLHIKKVKTGAARILLEAEKQNDYKLGVHLIPIGLHFFSRSRFRSKVLVNVGRPIDLKPSFALNEKDNFTAVNVLSGKIQHNLEQLTVNIKHSEQELFIKDIENIYLDELLSETPSVQKPSGQTVAEFVLSQKIADCVEYYTEHAPQKVRDMEEKVNAYKRKLKRLHLKDDMVKEKTSLKKLYKAEMAGLTKAVIGFPLAAYGILNHFIPYRITEQIAKKFRHEKTKILTALFFGGGSLFILFYCFQTFLLWYFGGMVWAALYFLSLPVSGFFALTYIKNLREMNDRINLSFFIFTNRHLIGRMRRARNTLISEMNAYKEEFIKINDAEKANTSRLLDKMRPQLIFSDISHAVSLERYGPKFYEQIHWHGSKKEPRIALTFDDGPHPDSTPRILDVLKRFDIKATYFLVGKHLESHADIAKDIVSAGNEVGNHTFSHSPFYLSTVKRLREEIASTDELLRSTDETEPRFFRPPAGFFTKRVLDVVIQMGYMTVIGDVYPRDPHLPGVNRIVDRVLERTVFGSIIILHDGGNTRKVDRSQTLEAVSEIIPRLKEKGFEFVTLSELLFE